MKSSKKRIHPLLMLALSVSFFLVSCAPARYVPEGRYLLDRVEIKTDARDISRSDLSDYLRQTPNSYVLGLFRMQLGIYNLSGPDSTKWFNRTLRRIGQPPVIFDSLLTQISADQLRSYHVNRGYYNAHVTAMLRSKDKKARLSYLVESGKPYRIQDYSIDLPFQELKEIAADSTRSVIQRHQHFDVYTLNRERERIARRMRSAGYYHFTREMLAFTADSANYAVDVSIQMRDEFPSTSDSLPHAIFRKYAVSKVVYNMIPSTSSLQSNVSSMNDTVRSDGYIMVGPADNFLTLSSLMASTFIAPGQLYSDVEVERTYAAINSLPPVKYTHISFREVAPDSLECLITIAEARSLTLSSQAEITFTEGYWGVAGNLGVVNRNIFKGAEALTLQGRLALERQEDVIAQEFGGQAGIRVPRTILPLIIDRGSRAMQGTTEFRSTFNYQSRPGEFSATNVGGGVKYAWVTGRQNHQFDLLDVSYVYFPWISQQFRDSFLTTGLYNRFNYDDYLIMRLSYSTAFNGYMASRPMRNYFTYRYGMETAGNLLYGFDKLLSNPVDENGAYRIFNIRYSQYIRGEFNSSYHQIIDQNNKLVYHGGIGVGLPYGNAEIIPFERRFYSGGANSVRGWSETTLGPGSYERFNSLRRDYNQLGDLKLDLNMEYRSKLFWVLEGALFMDAGNIWTIRDYANQPGGMFQLSSFWKEIALAYGAGVRMDFNFVMFRVDLGLKLYDPARIESQRWVAPSMRDFALHIAIGYPF